jgi:MFS family permease
VERYFATAMAFFALALTMGSQVGPMVAGFIITAKGWRWFFIVCAILIGVNLLLLLVFLPETNYRRVLYAGETAEEADKQAMEIVEQKEYRLEHVQTSASTTDGHSDLNVAYAGSYWKDLINFKNRGIEETGLLAWPRQFSLPFRFLLVPHVLFATLAYGIYLGGYVSFRDTNSCLY